MYIIQKIAYMLYFCSSFDTPTIYKRRGVQKVRSLTQLTTRYAHHILSLFNIVTCNWNALGPAFLQRSDQPGQRIWSHVSSSTGCHPKCQLWTTPSPTVFAIRVRTAPQMAGWKTRHNNYSSTTVSERWRNAEPSAFQLQVSMLKSDKIW